MRFNFKFNATKVDEIEQLRKLPIENCITDSSIGMLCTFIQKGLVDDNGQVGVSKAVAMNKIDEYLSESDKNELVMDIMEALCDGGFLSRELNIAEMREYKKKKESQVKEAISNELEK